MSKYFINYKNDQIGGKDLDFFYYLLFSQILPAQRAIWFVNLFKDGLKTSNITSVESLNDKKIFIDNINEKIPYEPEWINKIFELLKYEKIIEFDSKSLIDINFLYTNNELKEKILSIPNLRKNNVDEFIRYTQYVTKNVELDKYAFDMFKLYEKQNKLDQLIFENILDYNLIDDNQYKKKIFKQFMINFNDLYYKFSNEKTSRRIIFDDALNIFSIYDQPSEDTDFLDILNLNFTKEADYFKTKKYSFRNKINTDQINISDKKLVKILKPITKILNDNGIEKIHKKELRVFVDIVNNFFLLNEDPDKTKWDTFIKENTGLLSILTIIPYKNICNFKENYDLELKKHKHQLIYMERLELKCNFILEENIQEINKLTFEIDNKKKFIKNDEYIKNFINTDVKKINSLPKNWEDRVDRFFYFYNEDLDLERKIIKEGTMELLSDINKLYFLRECLYFNGIIKSSGVDDDNDIIIINQINLIKYLNYINHKTKTGEKLNEIYFEEIMLERNEDIEIYNEDGDVNVFITDALKKYKKSYDIICNSNSDPVNIIKFKNLSDLNKDLVSLDNNIVELNKSLEIYKKFYKTEINGETYKSIKDKIVNFQQSSYSGLKFENLSILLAVFKMIISLKIEYGLHDSNFNIYNLRVLSGVQYRETADFTSGELDIVLLNENNEIIAIGEIKAYIDGIKYAYSQMRRACKYLVYQDNTDNKNFFLSDSRKTVENITLNSRFKENIKKVLSNEINIEDVPEIFIVLRDGPIKNTCGNTLCAFQTFYNKLIKKDCLNSSPDGKSIVINHEKITRIFNSEIKSSNTLLDNLLYDKKIKEDILTTEYFRKYFDKNNLILLKETYQDYNNTMLKWK